jgi:hypothetical protein
VRRSVFRAVDLGNAVTVTIADPARSGRFHEFFASGAILRGLTVSTGRISIDCQTRLATPFLNGKVDQRSTRMFDAGVSGWYSLQYDYGSCCKGWNVKRVYGVNVRGGGESKVV